MSSVSGTERRFRAGVRQSKQKRWCYNRWRSSQRDHQRIQMRAMGAAEVDCGFEIFVELMNAEDAEYRPDGHVDEAVSISAL
ncbi:hypothetical protein [Rhizobium sp. CBN3]|uniref:hypothetical protein n=1 Tax=Rhizobium sp. CBN3 TaxID=3058045 RepID=UPI0034A090EB